MTSRPHRNAIFVDEKQVIKFAWLIGTIQHVAALLSSHAKYNKYSYTTGTSALPDIYARAQGPQTRGQVRIYQAKHSCPWYN